MGMHKICLEKEKMNRKRAVFAFQTALFSIVKSTCRRIQRGVKWYCVPKKDQNSGERWKTMDEHALPNEKSFVDDRLDLEHYEKCFIGSYSHSLDGKGRLVVPQPFREELGKTFYIAPSRDFSYAALYPAAAWAKVRDGFQKLAFLDQMLNMFLDQFDAMSFRGQECDAQGRLLLPPKVREELLLGEKDLEVTGANDHVRVIAASRAAEQRTKFKSKLQEILDHMGELEAQMHKK